MCAHRAEARVPRTDYGFRHAKDFSRPLSARRFVTPEIHGALFSFPKDMARVPTDVNRLNNQALVRYFESEWRRGPAQ